MPEHNDKATLPARQIDLKPKLLGTREVYIVGTKDRVIINASDFDPSKYSETPAEEKKTAPKSRVRVEE